MVENLRLKRVKRASDIVWLCGKGCFASWKSLFRMLIWAVLSDEEGRMACRNGLYYARPPDHCLYGTEKRAVGYLFPVLLSVFPLLIVFYFAKTICPYFFLLEVLNIHCIGVFFSGVLSLVRNVNGRAAVRNKVLLYEKKQMLKL